MRLNESTYVFNSHFECVRVSKNDQIIYYEPFEFKKHKLKHRILLKLMYAGVVSICTARKIDYVLFFL